MTPQVAKRKDGLCASLLDLNDATRAIKPQGGLNKPYRTNSRLLLQLRGRDNSHSDVEELQGLTEAVEKAVRKSIDKEGPIINYRFKAQGCSWHLELGPNLNDADENYFIEVALFANEVSGVANYVVDVMLKPKGEVDPNPLAPPLKGFREAKDVFEELALKVRKAIVRLEFPEFPEGCKGRPFREVYQLNARVSLVVDRMLVETTFSNFFVSRVYASLELTAQVRIVCYCVSWNA